MHSRINDDTRVTEQAAQWLGELLEGNERRTAFFQWAAESPRHVEEFLKMLSQAQELASATPDRRARIRQWGATLGTNQYGPSNVISLSGSAASLSDPPSGGIRRRRTWARVAAAAVILAALAVGWWAQDMRSHQIYFTAVGEQRAVVLADHSTVHLNTDSRIEVRLTGKTRSVSLQRGEALFSVEQDPVRPFQVRSGDMQIVAVGTRFDVYERAAWTRVTVIEGAVKVTPQREAANFTLWPREKMQSSSARDAVPTELLKAGDAAELSSRGTVLRRERADPVKAVAWQQGRLVFEDDRLERIAAEFNRYNSKIKIRVLGDAAEQHFSGTFNANAPEAIMQALTEVPTLRVDRLDGEIVIRRRAQ